MIALGDSNVLGGVCMWCTCFQITPSESLPLREALPGVSGCMWIELTTIVIKLCITIQKSQSPLVARIS